MKKNWKRILNTIAIVLLIIIVIISFGGSIFSCYAYMQGWGYEYECMDSLGLGGFLFLNLFLIGLGIYAILRALVDKELQKSKLGIAMLVLGIVVLFLVIVKPFVVEGDCMPGIGFDFWESLPYLFSKKRCVTW